MADSDNILSILSSLGGAGGNTDPSQGPYYPPQTPAAPPAPAPDAPQTNVMQAAAPAPQASAYQDPTAQITQAATQNSPSMPKPRRSLLDTIGKISDVLATVGGAHALYQPTLDANTARDRATSDHDLATQKAQLDLATGKFDLSDKQQEHANNERERFASVLGAVNDGEDAGNLPALMAAAGLTDPRYTPFVNMVQKNPEAAKTLASALGGDGTDQKLGHNLYFGTDQTGKTVAYQIGDDGQAHILNFSGVTPGEPSKVVNTGGQTVVVGSQTGGVKRIIPNTVSPNTAANNAQSDTNNRRTTSTQITLAGMPARAQPGKAGKGAPDATSAYTAARTGLTNLSAQLDKIINDPDLAHSVGPVGFVMRHLPGTAAQRVEGNITTAQGQALVGAINNLKALSANGNLGFRLTQQEANAFGASMAGALKNTNQSPTDYANNLRDAQTRIRTMISQLDEDAKRKASTPSPAATASTKSSGLPVLSPTDAGKLKPGTHYLGFDGQERIRP